MYLNSLKSTYFEFLVFTQMECFCSGAMGTQNSDIFSELRYFFVFMFSLFFTPTNVASVLCITCEYKL